MINLSAKTLNCIKDRTYIYIDPTNTLRNSANIKEKSTLFGEPVSIDNSLRIGEVICSNLFIVKSIALMCKESKQQDKLK